MEMGMSEVVSQQTTFAIPEFDRLYAQMASERANMRSSIEDDELALKELAEALAAKKRKAAKLDRKFDKIEQQKRLMDQLIASLAASFVSDDDDDEGDDTPIEVQEPDEVQEVESEVEVPSAVVEPPPAPVQTAPGAMTQPKPTSQGKVGARAPSTKRGSVMTVPEQVAAAMGTDIYDAAGLEPVLKQLGIKSNNPRAYSSSIFSTKMHVPGPDGKDLRKDDGTFVEVRMFVKVDHGRHRVATPDEIQREARKILGSDEVIISRSAVDVMFEEQGIEIPVINARVQQ